MEPTARQIYRLVEPIHLVTYFAPEPTAELVALGLRNYWDGYFAGRAAPLGLAPAEVVHAAFYNFADGEVARHIPRVWQVTTPEQALGARQRGAAAALKRILGDLARSPALARTADLAIEAASAAPPEGRVLYAGLRALPVPDEPVARLWHAATLLREHRGDGHVAALVAAGIGGTAAHMLHALSIGVAARAFGRVHHLPPARLTAVIEGLRARGLIDEREELTDSGRDLKDRIEALTDRLAAPSYDAMEPDALKELIVGLRPIAAALDAVGSH